MSKQKRNKKSTTKHQRFETSRVIPIIAVFEVIVLIAVGSFAWYFFNANKTLSSGVITVNADSGLEIDFKDADKSTFIDIFDYIDKQNFYFEPASSVDGRNIVFPTSGTFGSTNTTSMVFRDGTVNDINSKYVNVDFELTNTTASKMEVYLSHNSFFTISEENSDQRVNGKALRLALYNNDGNTGNVSSNLVSNINKTAATESPTQATQSPTDEEGQTVTYYEDFTIYFNTTGSDWSNVKAYIWNHDDGNSYISSWPGDSMVKESGNLYSYSFSNPYTISGGTKTYYYDRVVFNNGSGTQTVDITDLASKNNYIYSLGTQSGGKYNVTSTPLVLTTVYFLKPTNWTTPACLTSTSSISSVSGAHEMTQVTTGIYSYTFPSNDTYIRFIDNADTGRKSNSASVTADKLYYFPQGGAAGELSTIDYSTSSIYFYNTGGWKQPYACVNAFAAAAPDYTYEIPMVALSGDLFYCSLPSVYLKDRVTAAGGTPASLAGNCQVYFKGETSGDSSTTETTVTVDTYSEHVYRMLSTKTDNKYNLDDEDYSDEVNINEHSYAVISPGVSAGFQRAANPVNEIDTSTGAVTSIIPTFASSFDDFLIGSDNPVFTIESQETVNMSMIIWLEGTDTHCTNENYAGKDINLYLEFSTALAGDKIDGTYTYQFVDSTEQVWTSDTITNSATGVTVSPVMQLYDKTIDRGYLMHGKTYTTYAGRKKVKVWECIAPQVLVNDPLNHSQHEIEFRRVNPYDEGEVWNRWEAGIGSEYFSDSYSSSSRIVTFTAFADGSPDPGLYLSGDHAISGLPDHSCGGLWGTYETEILTVYDGRKDRDVGTLNFGYTYHYPNSNKNVTIEYKASGYRDLVTDASNGYQGDGTYFNNFYSIVIPTKVFQNGSSSYFIDYRGIDGDHAINSNLNTNITVGNKWSSGAIRGRFFEFNEEYDFSNNANKSPTSNYHSYWGSDVLYMQGRSTLSVSYSSASNYCFMQVQYTGSGSNYYSYLYDNGNYQGSYGYGFVSVVPCENNSSSSAVTAFTDYKIQRTLKGDHSTITREATLTSHITSTTETYGSNTIRVNTINQTDSSNDGRIRILDYDYKIIYYQSSNWGSEWNHPSLYSDMGSWIHNGDDTGKKTDSDGGKVIYSYHVRSDYKAKFNFPSASEKWSVDITPADGYCYYPSAYNVNNSGKVDVGGYNSGLSAKGLHGNGDGNGSGSSKYNQSLNTYTVDNASWPEYTAKQVKS
ncbi:MAG: starch-binding protein [Ruminococcus sp.]|nr:starch-binding protein [Ruminococcus sp.]